ncbi:hypothetical protein BU17DRAFT_65931 [Hysterangium stoloniferum]|nr:hypothetical protein BU17DRAFT_65931 [Hysterangium stoloniferum]
MPHSAAAASTASKVYLNAILLIEHNKFRYCCFKTTPDTVLLHILKDIFPHLAQEQLLEEILLYRATTNIDMVPTSRLPDFVRSLNLQTDFKGVAHIGPVFECTAEIDRSKLHYVFQCPTYKPAAHINQGTALQLMPQVAPSQGGYPSVFRERQKDDSQAINCGRPAGRQATIPPVLYDEILAKFQDDCVSGEPTFEDKHCAEEMAARLPAFFKDEAARMEAFREILDKHDIVKLDKFSINSYTTDGSYVLTLNDGYGGKIHVVFVEGPFVTAAGAVATPIPNVQIISPFLLLHFHRSDNIQRLNLCRFIFANEEGKHEYTYIKAISPDQLVFRATTVDTKTKICIKFLPPGSYLDSAIEVQKYAAGGGFAPAILGVNFLSAGWTMVVMEDLVDHYMPFQASDRTDLRVREALQAALKNLDSKGYVHGDLRKENILVRGKSAMGLDNGGLTSRVKFVDFEWSGPEGVVEYPLQLNTTQIQRPVDAVSTGPIRKAHDRQMVEYLFRGD